MTTQICETHALVQARAFVASDAWSLTLIGDTGVGKTFAAQWALGELKREWRAQYEGDRRPVPYHNAPRLVVATELGRKLFEREGERPFVDVVRDCGVLVLDDLGIEHIGQQGAFFAVADEIVNHRHRLSMRTIVTTNLASEQLMERYGERIYDRLRDGMTAECGGDSLRGK